MKLCYNDMVRLTVGSLFSGCGGLDLGIERAGFDIKWMSESDKFCRKVLQNRWPNVPIFDDSSKIDGALMTDVLIGGFPCQPVSLAGMKNGLDDPRWLWPIYESAIRKVRPAYVIVENVPGLFVRGFGDVLGALALQGYDAEWFSLQSSDIGAPHRRKRIFILATNSRLKRHRQERGETLRKQEEVGRQKINNFIDGSGESQLSTASLADAISGRFKKRQQGWKLQLIEPFSETPTNTDSQYEYRSMVGWQGRREKFADGYFGPYEEAVRRWERLFGQPPNPRDEKGRLNASFVEWMLGFPEDWTEGLSRTQRMKMLGNSVQVQCAEVVGNVLKEKVNSE